MSKIQRELRAESRAARGLTSEPSPDVVTRPSTAEAPYPPPYEPFVINPAMAVCLHGIPMNCRCFACGQWGEVDTVPVHIPEFLRNPAPLAALLAWMAFAREPRQANLAVEAARPLRRLRPSRMREHIYAALGWAGALLIIAVVVMALQAAVAEPVREPAAICHTDSECAEFDGDGGPADEPLVPAMQVAACPEFVSRDDEAEAPGEWRIPTNCEVT